MIADVSSAGAAAPSTTGELTNPKGQLGKDEFLKLLVAQLKNQDPMNPLKGEDMAAQLAQFSSLEQLTNISTQLKTQAANQESVIGSINDTTAMAAIGKRVLAVGDQLSLAGDGSGSVTFEVGGEGGLATLNILDSSGAVVGSRELGFVGAGRQEAELGSAVENLPPGFYHYAVDVVDAGGKVVPSRPFISATVESVEYGPDGPVLTSGPIRMPFGTILQIADSSAF